MVAVIDGSDEGYRENQQLHEQEEASPFHHGLTEIVSYVIIGATNNDVTEHGHDEHFFPATLAAAHLAVVDVLDEEVDVESHARSQS